MTPRFPAQYDCLQDEGPRRRSWIIGKDESRSHPSGPEEMRLRRTGGVDVREQTRLPALRMEGCDGFEGTLRLEGGKVQSCWGQRVVEKQTKFKTQFSQKAGMAEPSFCITHSECLIALRAVSTRSPLAKAEEEEEGVISDSGIIKTLSDAHTPNFALIPYSSTRWTGGVLTIASQGLTLNRVQSLYSGKNVKYNLLSCS